MKRITKLLAILALALVCIVCLVACEQVEKYTVTCQDSEHGYVTASNTSVEAGEKVILAAHPNAGYQLSHFVVDGEVLDGCSFIMPEHDVTVSAEFEVITYTITYVLGDATVAGNNPTTYTVESVPTLIQPEKEGYEICGWYRYHTEPENNYDWDIEYFRVLSLDGQYGDLTLYAAYYNPLHEITWNSDSDEGGWFYVESYEACYGDTVNVVVEAYTGYEFEVFVNGAPIEGTTFTMPMSDVEVSVVFTLIVYQIRYVYVGCDGNAVVNPNPITFTVESGYIYLEYPTLDGYTFIGWYLDENCSEYVNQIYAYDYVDKPLVLYALFEKDA